MLSASLPNPAGTLSHQCSEITWKNGFFCAGFSVQNTGWNPNLFMADLNLNCILKIVDLISLFEKMISGHFELSLALEWKEKDEQFVCYERGLQLARYSQKKNCFSLLLSHIPQNGGCRGEVLPCNNCSGALLGHGNTYIEFKLKHFPLRKEISTPQPSLKLQKLKLNPRENLE